MLPARGFVYALRIRAFDLLFHPLVALTGSLACFALSIVLRHLRPGWSLSLLCRSHCILLRAGPNRGLLIVRLNRLIERRLKRAIARGGLVEFVAVRQTGVEAIDLNTARIAGLVLKAPQYDGGRMVERGVLLLKNTERLDSFRRRARMLPILEQYFLVLEPSWSAYASPRLLSFSIFRDHPIVVMSPCQADHRLLDVLKSNLRPIPTGAGDWVDPRIFRPLEGSRKQFDAVMVARWTLLKRHHCLLRALHHVADPSFRVALVAPNIPGDTDREPILAMIRKLRLGAQVTVFEDLEPAGVNDILNQSKVNLLLSRQEGGNRSLFEGFFAGVPGLAFANHVGIALSHFTPQTGRLISEHELADALLYFRRHWAEFDPRTWALKNIAPQVTTSKLNLVLQQLAQERNERWTRDIVGKCNSPELRYYPDESAGQGFSTMEDLLAQPELGAAGGPATSPSHQRASA
jgi:glycosyltransferase involved in cell wall biosynthesis